MKLRFVTCSALLVLGVISVVGAKNSGMLHLLEKATRQKRQTATGCSGSVTNIGQPEEILSFNFPEQYPVNDVCKWRIQAPNGKVVRLQFINLEVEDSEGCQYDSLKVYDGRNAGSTLLNTICGNVVPPVIQSSGRFMFLKFTSDYSDTGRGFRISVTFANAGGSTSTTGPSGGVSVSGTTASPSDNGSGNNGQNQECGQQYITSDSQTIQSPINPSSPQEYPDNAECRWHIQAPAGKIVKLFITQGHTFGLEGSTGCVYDHLSIYDGESENSLVLGRFCGNNFPTAGIASTGNELYLVFTSDNSLTASGFHLSMEFVSPDVTSQNCGGILTGASGQLNSPNFGGGNKYPNNADCTWVIDVGHDKVVKLEFSDFKVEDGPNCMYDAVTIYNGENKNSPMLGSFCGNSSPGLIESTGKYLLVEFKSDSSVRKQGFAATYSAITVDEGPKETPGCGASRPALLSETTGSITSPTSGPNGHYPDNSLCQWRITVPTGKRAHLHVQSFGLEDASSCQYDHLEIYDGADSSSRKLGRYCGDGIPGDITATGNVLFVQFTSDSSVTDEGFDIVYSAKDAGGNTNPGGDGDGNGGQGSDNGEPACGIPEVIPKFGRIVGGTEATAHSWPWQISLRRYGSHSCGGSILSKRWIVTAAHCVDGYVQNPSMFSVSVGEHDRKITEGTEQILNVAAIVMHEQYDDNTVQNDIALLRLTADITYSRNVKPVCLPRGDAATDMTCVTTGWGSTQGTGDETVLNQVRVPIIDRELCKQRDWYGSSFTPEMICAGYPEGGKDSCQGDSGGPMVCRENGVFRLHGVTSWGFGCAQPRAPGIYTRVARYVDWVDTKTSGAFQAPP